jgi:hypothetical protein
MNINTKGLATSTVSITDHQIVAAKVAKVIVAFTGRQTKESLTEALTAQLKHLATPIESSFRIVKDNVAVGFIRANREIRAVDDDNQLKANYRVMASNIMMDNRDRTLWELKEGTGGKFLARHGEEDLSELVHAATKNRTDIPKIRNLALATAGVKEFVAYAGSSGDMEYGFCIQASTKDEVLKVVSKSSRETVVIPMSAVAGVYDIKIPLSAHKKITAAGWTRDDVKQSKDYYSQLYAYAPDYLDEVISQIEESAAL